MNFKIYTQKEKEKLRELSKSICKNISVAEIADNLYGLTLYHSKNNHKYLKCYEHPSLVIDTQKNVAYFNAQSSSGFGLSGFDFVAFYEGISYLSAREKLNEYYKKRDPRNLELYYYDSIKDTIIKHKGVYLPKMNKSNDQIIQFLLDKGISEKTINDLLNESIIYEDEKHNMIVVGYDIDSSLPVSGLKLGTKDKRYIAECHGSYNIAGIPFMNLNNSENNTLNIYFDIFEMINQYDKNPNEDFLYIQNTSNIYQTLSYYNNYFQSKKLNNINICIKQNTYDLEKINALLMNLKKHNGNYIRNLTEFKLKNIEENSVETKSNEFDLERAKQVAAKKREEIEEEKLLQQQQEMSL